MAIVSLRNPTDFAALIRERRKELGLDQAQLASRVGVSRLWVNQIEGGKSGASLGLVLKTLAALGLDLKASSPHEWLVRPDGTQLSVFTPDINAIVENAKKRS